MCMIGIVKTVTSEFPGKGEVLIHFAFSENFKKEKQLLLLNSKTNNLLFSKLDLYEFSGKEEETVSLELNDFYKHIIIVGLGKEKEFTLLKWRDALANTFRKIKAMKCTSATVAYTDVFGVDYFEVGKQLSLAFHLSNYSFDEYKSEEEKKKVTKLKELSILVTDNQSKEKVQEGIDYGQILAKGVNFSRDLVNHPASHQSPETLVRDAFEIEKKSKGRITVEVFDKDECQRFGMGAFLGVAQGSDKEPKFIVLHYIPEIPSSKKKICLIGKSIIYDTGGLSLKPPKSMETMKCDMAGGATVLGVFHILSNLLNVETSLMTSLPDIYGILPACENMPSGKALRPGDIVTVLNKKTIEVLNTDAEGRLTLADAISYAEKYIKPNIIVDMATLTGACVVALGTDIAGIFGNDDKLTLEFEKNAKEEGEELWRLPLFGPYFKSMKSDIADLKNVEGGHYGGTITAALFLKEFVKEAKWIHIDTAGPAFNEGGPKGIIPKGGTGWGVLTVIKFLRNI